jgi:MFS family permease
LASRRGMRRPWMVTGLAGGCLGILVVALASSIPVVLAGWCIAQLCFNALLAAMVAVLPDQVPSAQRGLISGVLGVCLPVASVCATFLVKLFTGSLLAMFLGPCAIGGFFILFVVTLQDRRLARADKPKWSLREFASTFYVNPRKNPDFSWAFRQSLHVRNGLRVPGYLPGLLPAGQHRNRQGRCAAADIPGYARPVRRHRRRLPHRREAL